MIAETSPTCALSLNTEEKIKVAVIVSADQKKC